MAQGGGGRHPAEKNYKVCVHYADCCFNVKIGLSGHRQRLLVNQCLLSYCVNTITQMTRKFGFKIKNEREISMNKNGGEFLTLFWFQILGTLDFQGHTQYLGAIHASREKSL